ncbi:MAG TPA: hypothetical protein PKD19_01715 [Candidatus Saccharibacteria bacterium]|jgi:hypothetical protein|nr:hypothetical protein [Candidatus Saccharibacteria bacterium]HMR38333.1 hypothetical protein [Candidatus Saccharibacteria bacterium]
MAKKKRTRTYGRNREYSRRGNLKRFESDSTYFLKLIIVFLLGTLWIKLKAPMSVGPFLITGLPIGTILGIFLVSRFEQFQSDRKIWYAVLVVVTILSYFLPAGIVF